MNTAPPPLADDSDGHKGDRMLSRKEGYERLGFDLEVIRFERQGLPCFQVDKAKATLRVGQMPACPPRQLAAHPLVHLPPEARNGVRIVHAVADDQQCPRPCCAIQEARHILGRVLAVAIESKGPFKTLLPR